MNRQGNNHLLVTISYMVNFFDQSRHCILVITSNLSPLVILMIISLNIEYIVTAYIVSLNMETPPLPTSLAKLSLHTTLA